MLVEFTDNQHLKAIGKIILFSVKNTCNLSIVFVYWICKQLQNKKRGEIMEKQSNLFISTMTTGIYFCDKSKEEFGDYMVIARLPFSTTKLEIRKPKSNLIPEIEAYAAKYKIGDEIQVSGCGQTAVFRGLTND